MAPRRVKLNKFDYKKLTTNDVICPVCRSILIKPVTLPCSHGFCASCFETTTQNANLVCPLCRVRIGSWLRTATKSKKLINESFWQAIQDLFPLQVKNKLNGREENSIEDKFKLKVTNDTKREIATKVEMMNAKQNEFGPVLSISKVENNLISIPSTSVVTKTAGPVNTIAKSYNQTAKIVPEKNGKSASVLLNNFATKEYTCRILCQNSKDTQPHVTKESLTLIQRKSKRIQKITGSELNDRSNSIESECLYFKPIDYRHNPPSEGLAPIKVPTRKPNVSPNVKILAPCGQNQISMNSLESAFARLFSPTLSEEKSDSKKGDITITPIKRKYEQSDCKSKKKMKIYPKSIEWGESKSDVELNFCDNSSYGDNFNFPISNSNNNVRKCTNVKQSNNLVNVENTKRSMQERADFEFATKLQQTFNQSAKYSTRSTALKRAAAKKQVKIEGIMTPYKVK